MLLLFRKRPVEQGHRPSFFAKSDPALAGDAEPVAEPNPGEAQASPHIQIAPVELPPAVIDAFPMADLLDDLVLQKSTDPEFTRLKLTELHDEYVDRHGPPADNEAFMNWLAAPSLPEGDADAVEDAHGRVVRLIGAEMALAWSDEPASLGQQPDGQEESDR